MNYENNVPTVWNAALLLSVALACVAVTALVAEGRLRWAVAALAAAFMAADELLRLHERLAAVGSLVGRTTGADIPTYAWVLPGALLAAALAVLLVLWVRGLPSDAARRVLLGGALYLAGAIVLEALSGWIQRSGGVTLAYDLVTTAEEGLEMIGCVVVLSGVLRLLVLRTVGTRRWVAVRA